MSRVTIVNLRSLSYSGTSWVNLVLASHPDAIALGPPDRIVGLTPEEGRTACLVHRADCSFWPGFVERWDRDGNFFLQLAEFADRRIIVVNNPTAALMERHFDHPDIDVKPIVVVRDGRANLASLMHHDPAGFPTVDLAARTWLLPAWRSLRGLVPDDESKGIVLQYERLARDHVSELRRVGAYLGISYPDNALRYWEHGHHLIAGNTGVVDLLRRFEGLAELNHRRRDYYDAVFERTKSDPDHVVIDESWRERFTVADRVAYDLVVGELHEAFGYERDRFAAADVQAFLEQNGWRHLDDSGAEPAPGVAPKVVTRSGLRGLMRRLVGSAG